MPAQEKCDRPDMTLDVYRGRKTTTQQQRREQNGLCISRLAKMFADLPVKVYLLICTFEDGSGIISTLLSEIFLLPGGEDDHSPLFDMVWNHSPIYQCSSISSKSR